jgi:anti-anti-sigma regulatory factor
VTLEGSSSREVVPVTIRLETDSSGRRVLMSVTDDHRGPAALAELLAALPWTSVDEIVVDLSRLAAIDMRRAVVLARAARRHRDVGRQLSVVCPSPTLTYALHAVGLDGVATICSSLAETGWRSSGPHDAPAPRPHTRGHRHARTRRQHAVGA